MDEGNQNGEGSPVRLREIFGSGNELFRHGMGFMLSDLGTKIILTVVAVLIVSILIYPVVFVILTSIIKGQVIITSLDDLTRHGLSLEHYVNAISDPDFISSMMISLLVSILTIIIAVIVITPAAYAFSRFKFWGRDAWLTTYLVLSQVGGGFGIAAVIALYVFLLQLNAMGFRTLGNPVVLSLIYVAGAVPFQTWLLKSYFDNLPKGLDEAAVIDGASWGMIIFRVVLPASKPAMIIVALFAFMGAWGEFIIADFLRVRTLAAYIYESAIGQTIYWSDFAAETILFAIPIIILYVVAQRYIGEAMRYGAVKG
jgi:arabinogalactan oligomer/maltooligosaccharide transport system permease protein